jgi:hypothetical protein
MIVARPSSWLVKATRRHPRVVSRTGATGKLNGMIATSAVRHG